MRIRIKETGEYQELIIIDPKNGVNWASDLLGNHDALSDYDEENDCYELELDAYDWWADLISRYQSADNRYHELLKELSSYDAEQLELRMADVCCDDLEVVPNRMDDLCDEYELFGRVNDDGNIDVFSKDGDAATVIDNLVKGSTVYPVGSDFSCHYEHPEGITITPADADKLNLSIES